MGSAIALAVISATLLAPAAFAAGEPIVKLLVPANNSYVNSLPQISGTAWDDVSVSSVVLTINRLSDNFYWAGSSWTPGQIWLDANYSMPNWTSTGTAWSDGETYTLVARVMDSSSTWSVAYATSVFMYDVTSPTSSIVYPVDSGYVAQTGKAAGFAYDAASGVNNVYVRIMALSGANSGKYWSVSGSNWSAGVVNNDVVTYGTLSPGGTWWQLNAAPWTDGDTYHINAYAADRAGNFQLYFATVTNVTAQFGSSTTITNVQYVSASTSSLSLSWTLDTPATEQPLMVLSTMASFGVAVSSTTGAVGDQTKTYYGLSANTTYYFKVKVSTASDAYYSSVVSTATAIEAPASVYFDDVTTYSVTASAYAPVFTNLDKDGSGVNLTTGAAYGVWNSTGNYWTTKAPMPTARAYLAAGAAGGKLYALGGAIAGPVYLNTNEEYDPAANSWITKMAMPTARGNFTAGVAGGKLYALGGYTSSFLNANEEYDPETNTWSIKAALPTGRRESVAAGLGGKLYLLGGYNGSKLNTNEEYDPAANTWAVKAAMPSIRNWLAAGVVAGKLYAVGGIVAAGYTNANEEYDPITNTWAIKAAMPTAREGLAAGVIGGKLYAAGGRNADFLNICEEYDPISNIWVARAAMPVSQSYLAFGAIGGKLYTMAGYNGAYLNANEEYTPGVAKTFSGLPPNTQYTFKAKARNQGGAETGEATVSTYTLAAVAQPVSGNLFSSVSSNSITVNWSSGTAAGGFNGAGASYKIQISTASNYSGTPITTATYNLSYTASGLTNGITYYFRAQAYNSLGVTDHSWLVLGSTVAATPGADTTPPTVQIVMPVNGAYYKALASVSGTAWDNVEVSTTDISIQNLGTANYWDGNAWVASFTWLNVVGSTGTWTYSIAGPPWVDGSSYTVVARARDTSNNWSSVYSTVTFIYDVTAPIAMALSPTGTVSSVASISGTASDAAPGALNTSGVMMSIKQLDGAGAPSCYDGTSNAFVACPVSAYPNDRLWLSTGTVITNTWSWNTTSVPWVAGSTYGIIALAIDFAGNMESYPAQETYDITFNYSGSYKTRVGSAASWQWKTPQGGDYVPSGSANSWQWLIWTPASGRKVPQGDASGWTWGTE